MTLGEYRLGVDLNPSDSPKVDELKCKGADPIDAIQHRAVDAGSLTASNSPTWSSSTSKMRLTAPTTQGI